MEEAVEEVGNAEVAELLALVRGVVVAHSKGSGDGGVLDGGGDEDGDTAAGHLADERRVGHLGMLQPVRLDLGDFKEEVVGVTAALVDAIADTCEKDKSEKRAGDGQEPNDLVLGAPPFTGLLEDGQKDDTRESDGAGVAVAGWQLMEDVVDLSTCAVAHTVLTEKRVYLVQNDRDGDSRNETTENGERYEF